MTPKVIWEVVKESSVTPLSFREGCKSPVLSGDLGECGNACRYWNHSKGFFIIARQSHKGNVTAHDLRCRSADSPSRAGLVRLADKMTAVVEESGS
jgi:hypothetical protein